MAETRLRRNANRHISPLTINERPLFMQNGSNRRFPSSPDTLEISTFRSALPQFIAVSIKNILLFGYGMTLGFPTIVIPAIQGGEGREHSGSDIVLNKDQISWFSSINLICVPLGCLFSGVLTQPIGKRRAMQFVNLPILAAWLLFHFATSTEHLYAALCLAGLGGGLMEAPVLTYVAEITEPKYRGILSALGTTCIITGVFVQFILGSLMDWRSVAAVSAACPIISIITLCFVPESPVWLIREQRFHEAVKSLQWLRGWVPEQYIEAEFNQLYDELITQPQLLLASEYNGIAPPKTCAKRLHMFRKRTFLVPFLLVAFTFFTGHFSGKTPLQTYAVQIFHTLKAPMNKYHATILLGVAELLSTITGVILIHFTGKRPLVLVSTVGTGLCFFGTATYAHYLNVLPGFAVNNVVVNASAIVPTEDIISQANITKIFEEQLTKEENLLAKLKYENDGAFETTTLVTFEPLNRTRRALENDTSTEYDFYENATDILGYSTYPPEIIATTNQIETKPTAPPNVVPAMPKQAVDDLLLAVPKQEHNYLVWLPLILLLLAAFFSHLGIRMIPWILIGEVFPADIRNTASGISGGIGYIFGFLANKLFIFMITNLTLPGTFWLYAAVAFFGTIVLYYVLPETEGRTLGEIEAHFSKKSSFDLFKKSKMLGKNEMKSTSFQLKSVYTPEKKLDSKVIQLQQSDFVIQGTQQQQQPQQVQQPQNPTQRRLNGETNLAYETSNNTTHL